MAGLELPGWQAVIHWDTVDVCPMCRDIDSLSLACPISLWPPSSISLPSRPFSSSLHVTPKGPQMHQHGHPSTHIHSPSLLLPADSCLLAQQSANLNQKRPMKIQEAGLV